VNKSKPKPSMETEKAGDREVSLTPAMLNDAGFGFEIPENATITGVEVVLSWSAYPEKLWAAKATI
jgi:hypothetical protein